MIAGVRGTLEAAGDSWVIVAVGGVSLKVSVPGSAIATLGGVGSTVRLHTHLVVREDDLALYGFPRPEALRLFQLLLTVSGIGPRLALSLLNACSPETLALAIVSGDAARLQQTPGIGRKTAERLVLELREKLAGERALLRPGHAVDQDDVLAALLSLGYSATEAQRVLRQVPPDPALSLEERVRVALQRLAGE